MKYLPIKILIKKTKKKFLTILFNKFVRKIPCNMKNYNNKSSRLKIYLIFIIIIIII